MVAKLGERRQALYAEERDLEAKLKTLDKEGTRFSVKDGDKNNESPSQRKASERTAQHQESVAASAMSSTKLRNKM